MIELFARTIVFLLNILTERIHIMKSKTKNDFTVNDVQIYLNIGKLQAYTFTNRKHFPSSRFGGTIHELYRLFLVNSLRSNEVSAHVAT